MHEGPCQNTPGLFGRVSRWFGSQHGHFLVDAGVALGLIAIVVAQSWARYGPVTRWRVHSAAHVFQRDLRLTQQTALSATAAGARAELCLRADGYDVYAVAPQLSAGQPAHASGAKIKSATAGQEYARGIEIMADATATYHCTADPTRRAFVYLASGAPKFPDTIAHSAAVTFHGQALHVTIQPSTGTTSVSP